MDDLSFFAYDLGTSPDRYIDDYLSRGRAYFSREPVTAHPVYLSLSGGVAGDSPQKGPD
jgi:hypothetical protein